MKSNSTVVADTQSEKLPFTLHLSEGFGHFWDNSKQKQTNKKHLMYFGHKSAGKIIEASNK